MIISDVSYHKWDWYAHAKNAYVGPWLAIDGKYGYSIPAFFSVIDGADTWIEVG